MQWGIIPSLLHSRYSPESPFLQELYSSVAVSSVYGRPGMKLSPTLAAFTNGVAVRQALPGEALLCGAFKTLISIAGSSLAASNQAPWGPLEDWVDVVIDAASALVARTPLARSPLHQKTLISISLADSLHGL